MFGKKVCFKGVVCIWNWFIIDFEFQTYFNWRTKLHILFDLNPIFLNRMQKIDNNQKKKRKREKNNLFIFLHWGKIFWLNSTGSLIMNESPVGVHWISFGYFSKMAYVFVKNGATFLILDCDIFYKRCWFMNVDQASDRDEFLRMRAQFQWFIIDLIINSKRSITWIVGTHCWNQLRNKFLFICLKSWQLQAQSQHHYCTAKYQTLFNLYCWILKLQELHSLRKWIFVFCMMFFWKDCKNDYYYFFWFLI